VLETLDGGGLRPVPRPPTGAPLLILGDLGAYASAAVQAQWRAFVHGAAATGRGVRALVPCPRERWPRAVVRGLRARVWDRTPRAAVAGGPAAWERAARALLQRVAPLVFCEPGLLRTLRFLRPPGEADVGTEIDVWARSEQPHVDGGTLAAQDRADLLHAIAAAGGGVSSETLRTDLAAIARWRDGSPALVALEERCTLRRLLPPDLAATLPGSVEEDLAMLLRLAGSLEHDATGLQGLAAWVQRVWDRLPAAGHERPDVVRAVEAAWRIASTGRRPGDAATWHLVQDGAALSLQNAAAPTAVVLGEIVAGHAALAIEDEQGRKLGAARLGEAIELPAHALVVVGDRERVHVSPVTRPLGADAIWRERGGGLLVAAGERTDAIVLRWRPPEADASTASTGVWEPISPLPAWAAAAGCDAFGVWAEVAVRGVRFKLRRVPGGRFLMGSPPFEAGRNRDEEQRRVELTGHWMAETAVTQALWQAVMGENPSRFVDPQRPVEQVSWDDCQRFVARLNELVPGLSVSLPTEAQWEYACRAGEAAATYAGEMEILGDNNAPVLDAIAWYGGNSGVGFELADGWDSSDWPEKQHPHERAGTRRVSEKRPNGLGLYDMLGNVYEWCADWYGDYPRGLVHDPTGPETGDVRVLRGGSWVSFARYVRAAYRIHVRPGDRSGHVGCRLSRGQGELRAAEPRPAEPAPPPRQRGRWLERLVQGAKPKPKSKPKSDPKPRSP
jgi:formylglycine-generating enzyme required for sulfatase activity